ncbi:MAG: hypothetical protein WCD11_37495 [Solirubrobacteraceae bacterium]
MRKIINSAFVTLDGFTEDPRAWAIFDQDAGGAAAQTLQALDGMLMGRATYEYFADVMPAAAGPYADAIMRSASTCSPRLWRALTGTTPRSSAGTSSLP